MRFIKQSGEVKWEKHIKKSKRWDRGISEKLTIKKNNLLEHLRCTRQKIQKSK